MLRFSCRRLPEADVNHEKTCAEPELTDLATEPELTDLATRRQNAASAAPNPDPVIAMARPASLDVALKRLSAALDQLEAAAERLRRAGAEKRDLEDTLAVMQDDRGRLAHELDAALASTQVLEHATDEVAQRLGQAGTTLRRLLAVAEDGMA